MKDLISNSAKMYLRIAVINMMCFFLALSVSFFAASAFAKEIGYSVFGAKSAEERPQKLYDYYFADGDDNKMAEYEKDYTLSQFPIRKVTETGNQVSLVLTEGFCLAVLILFLYPSVVKLAKQDKNTVMYENGKADMFKGVKIGLLANVPSFILLAFLAATKNGISKKIPAALIKYTHGYAYSFAEWITAVKSDDLVKFGQLPLYRCLLLFPILLIVPAVCGISYYIGFKNKGTDGTK